MNKEEKCICRKHTDCKKMYIEGLGTPLIAFKTDNDISWVRKVVNGKGSKLLDSCGYEDLRD